jgi:hypothetical protein
LKKRRRRQPGNGSGSSSNNSDDQMVDDFPWETAESRPLVKASAREAGEDYWIDEMEFQRYQQREAQIRAIDPGQIPQSKLRTEVVNPYKQNWIGLISVSIIAIAFIFKNFPEVINPPMITNIPANL